MAGMGWELGLSSKMSQQVLVKFKTIFSKFSRENEFLWN